MVKVQLDIRTCRVQISSEVLLSLFFTQGNFTELAFAEHITENTSFYYNSYILFFKIPTLKRLATQSVIWKSREKTCESG